MQERGPQQHIAAGRQDPVLRVDLPVAANGVHVGLTARVEKADGAGIEVRAVGFCIALVRHIHVIGARQPGMRVIVKIVIIPAEIDIAPALDRPVELVVDAGARRIIEDRPVAALMQPLHGRVLASKEIVGRIIHRHIFQAGVPLHDHTGQHRVGSVRTRKANAHELGRPEIEKLRRRAVINGIVHVTGLLPRRVIWR